MIRWREAEAADVEAIVALLADDKLGAARETADLATYQDAFSRMRAEGSNRVIVGEDSTGRIVATYQLVIISGLSLRAARRAQVESVRVVADLRGQGIGAQLMADAETRARAAGCRLIQLTTHASRKDAHRFYDRLGFTPSHIGYKREID